MEKTYKVLLIYKKEDYNCWLYQALLSLPIPLSLSYISECDDAWAKSSQWILPILKPHTQQWNSALHTIKPSTFDQEPKPPIYRKWRGKTLTILSISLNWEISWCFLAFPCFFSLLMLSCVWQYLIKACTISFCFWIESFWEKVRNAS